MTLNPLWSTAVVLCGVACSTGPSPGNDAGGADAATDSGAGAVDAGSDAGTADAGSVDGGGLDGGSDAGVDAGVPADFTLELTGFPSKPPTPAQNYIVYLKIKSDAGTTVASANGVMPDSGNLTLAVPQGSLFLGSDYHVDFFANEVPYPADGGYTHDSSNPDGRVPFTADGGNVVSYAFDSGPYPDLTPW
jgi:hypothetical protein